MVCIKCGETVRASVVVCLVCGVTQPVPAAGSGLATPLDTSAWQPLPPAPTEQSPGGVFSGIVDVGECIVEMFGFFT